jgi:hypothetical protein
MTAKPAALLFLFLLLCRCADKNPVGPVIPGAEIRYGDTLIAGLRYQTIPDTGAAFGSAVEISLVLRNIAGRSLGLDSTSKGTSIFVFQDSTNSKVWAWPDVMPNVDTLVKKVSMKMGDSLFFRGKWQRLDFYRIPLPAGRYRFDGYIFGLPTGQVYYQSL